MTISGLSVLRFVMTMGLAVASSGCYGPEPSAPFQGEADTEAKSDTETLDTDGTGPEPDLPPDVPDVPDPPSDTDTDTDTDTDGLGSSTGGGVDDAGNAEMYQSCGWFCDREVSCTTNPEPNQLDDCLSQCRALIDQSTAISADCIQATEERLDCASELTCAALQNWKDGEPAGSYPCMAEDDRFTADCASP